MHGLARPPRTPNQYTSMGVLFERACCIRVPGDVGTSPPVWTGEEYQRSAGKPAETLQTLCIVSCLLQLGDRGLCGGSAGRPTPAAPTAEKIGELLAAMRLPPAAPEQGRTARI